MEKRIKSSYSQLEHLLRKEFDKDTLFPYLEWSSDLTCSMSVISSKVFMLNYCLLNIFISSKLFKKQIIFLYNNVWKNSDFKNK
jgi:hypothetical protein